MNKALILAVACFLLAGCTSNSAQDNINAINYDENGTENAVLNSSVPEGIIFNITDCKAVAYDFGGGVESFASALNCKYYTNKDCSTGYFLITLYSPSGETLSVKNYCATEGDLYQAQMRYLRMDDEWITPLTGPYRIVVSLSDITVYEKNITFKGYNVSATRSIIGSLTQDTILGGYYSYDSNFDYLKLTLINTGDLPVFTDSVSVYVDGDSGNVSPKFIILSPNTSAVLVFSWDGTLQSGIHSLNAKSFGTVNSIKIKLSDDTIGFYVPSLIVE